LSSPTKEAASSESPTLAVTPKYLFKNMEKLTNKEEEIMHILWKLEKAFVKDVLAEIKDDKPHYNTLSTIIRNLEEKGYVGYHAFGKTHQYFPLVSKEDYRNGFMNTAIDNYFNNSYKNMVSFFAKEEKISVEELKEIISLIENQK
jgi:BlaI family transcriptional regulator, penicillinase repressor